MAVICGICGLVEGGWRVLDPAARRQLLAFSSWPSASRAALATAESSSWPSIPRAAPGHEHRVSPEGSVTRAPSWPAPQSPTFGCFILPNIGQSHLNWTCSTTPWAMYSVWPSHGCMGSRFQAFWWTLVQAFVLLLAGDGHLKPSYPYSRFLGSK